MRKRTVYKVYGDNLGEGIFIHFKNADAALKGMAYERVADLNISKGHNGVYKRLVESFQGPPKVRHAYITWIECEDDLGPLPKARFERLKAEVPE